MPNPQPMAAPTERVLPVNLDELVRAALAGGDVSKVKRAMQEAQSEAIVPVVRAPSASSSPTLIRSVAQVDPGTGQGAGSNTATVTPPSAAGAKNGELSAELPADLGGLAGRLLSLAQNTATVAQENPREALEMLGRLRAMLDPFELALHRQAAARAAAPTGVVESAIAESPTPTPAPPRSVPVVLPRARHPYLLVVEGPGDVNLGARFAEALSVDAVTGRLLAVCRHPRVALRHEDAGVLAQAARRVRESLGLRAVVVGREQLLEVEAPKCVLAGSPDRTLALAGGEPWQGEEPDLAALRKDARTQRVEGVRVAVPGEVVVRTYRVGRGMSRNTRDEAVIRAAGERRVQLIDLHGPGSFVRVVEGITDTAGFPGHDPRSALRSIRGLAERLSDLWPAARVEGSRSCLPPETPQSPQGNDGEQLEVAGWPDWEEHTRACRFLAGLGP
jgi:hypothetical protein